MSEKKEEGLKKERFRSLFEAMTEGVVLIANDGQIVQANPAAERILGFKRSEIENRNYVSPKWKILRPDGTPMPPEEMAGPRAMKEKRPVKDVVMGVKHPDDSVAWINVNAVPIMNKTGKLEGVVGTFIDITERKKAEEELKGSEERLRVLFECAPDGIYLMDLKGNFTDGNKAAEELIGYKKEELTGKNMAKVGVLPKSQIPKALKNLAKNAMGRPTGPDEFTLIGKDGNKVEVEISTYPVKIKGKTLVLGIARDITERKKADEELKKSKEELETKVKDLERFSKLSVGRELRMIELKKRVKELEKQLKERSK